MMIFESMYSQDHFSDAALSRFFFNDEGDSWKYAKKKKMHVLKKNMKDDMYFLKKKKKFFDSRSWK